MKKQLCLIAVIVFFAQLSIAQTIPPRNKCGTMEYLDEIRKRDPDVDYRIQKFEEDIQKWITTNHNPDLVVSGIIKIPVVVHVLWNSSDVNSNISDEQIFSQIDVLNEDFQRNNADKINTPAAFGSPIAVDCQIQFALATMDPDSNPTSGILRKQTIVKRFTFDDVKDDIKFSQQGGDDPWPTDKYLNLWVGKFKSGLLGYGLCPTMATPQTDGVAIAYNAFGRTGNVTPPYNLGRTATHEVGHWLNLRHIWGDDENSPNGNCSLDDYCGDTPLQGVSSDPQNCALPAVVTDACSPASPGIMYMNFMDYSPDNCMNLFTQGQKTRMRSLFDLGEARESILTSPGLDTASGNNLVIKWQKSLGGTVEDFGNSIKQTTDGGYIVAGNSYSNDGNVTGNHGNGQRDYWVVKLNSSGAIQWQKSLGGTGTDLANSIQQTNDGGYIVAGVSVSNDGDVIGNDGGADYWIVKLSNSGAIQWQKTFGGTGYEEAKSVQQTSDNGYIMAGFSSSNDGDVTGHHIAYDCWIVKLDSIGVLQWQKSLGGSVNEQANSIQQTNDGGYIVAGWSNSNDGDVTGNHGAEDYWIVKLNSSGAIQWQKSLGGTNYDEGYSIQQTADGGYIAAGRSQSNDGDVTGNHGGYDYWIIKLNNIGTIQWQKSLGGTAFSDYGYSIQQTSDRGYIAAGFSDSNDGNVFGNHGGSDCWIVKLNYSGNIQWQKTLGGSADDGANSIQQTTDGGYIIAGTSSSNNGNVAGNHGWSDYWVVKLTECNATITTTPSQVYCPNTTPNITLKINETGTYLWSTGATTKSITVTSPGSYTATLTNGSCTATSKPVVIAPLSCNGPVLFSFTDFTNNTAHFVWEASSCGGSGYYLQYKLTSNSSWSASINIPYDADGTYNDSLTGLNTSSEYYCRIRSKCGGAIFSGWDTVTFCTGCPKPTAINVTNITQISAKIKWTGNVCAYKYWIQYRKQGTNTWTTKSVLSPIVTKTITGLTANSIYEYRLKTDCDVSGTPNSGYTSISTFTTLLRLGEESVTAFSDTEQLEINIKPNPVSDMLALNFSSENSFAEIKIVNIIGQIVIAKELFSEDGNYETQINVADLSKGMYLLLVQTENGMNQKRFVKE